MEKTVIIVLWPTVRPEVAQRAIFQWRLDAMDVNEIYFHVIGPAAMSLSSWVCVDSVTRRDFGRKGVCSPVSYLCQEITVGHDDIVILASDDFEAPKHWDRTIRETYDEFDGCLLMDGYKAGTNIVALPIIGGALFHYLNRIIYHPDYHHMFSDQELFDVVTEMKAIHDLRSPRAIEQPQFKHKHWSFGGRTMDQHDECNGKNWEADRLTYESRKKLTLKEKLVLPDWFIEETTK